MRSDDLTPHLNKIATLYLKNNKRKVGWIFTEDIMESSADRYEKVYFISVQKGKKLLKALAELDTKTLEPHCEMIPIEMIERVRSSK